MAVLREAVEKQRKKQERKKYLVDFLIDHGILKMQDGRQLWEVPLSELESLHNKIRCEQGKGRLIHEH